MKSWIYIGVFALAASTSISGCTITTGTTDGSGGDGGWGGSAGSGGDGGSGGTTDTGGAAASGGATTDGGASSQGGTSSNTTTIDGPSFTDAVAAYCELQTVAACFSDCATEVASQLDLYAKCESLFANQYACLSTLAPSDFKCGTDGLPTTTSTACDTETAAVDACTAQ